MQIQILKGKIHRATVTDANVNYEGSLAIAEDLVEMAGMREFERVLVGNLANGARFETYVILAPNGSGQVTLNGATAHLGKPGDLLTIMTFALATPEEAATHSPQIVRLGPGNIPSPLLRSGA